jgi:hypothetical protein
MWPQDEETQMIKHSRSLLDLSRLARAAVFAAAPLCMLAASSAALAQAPLTAITTYQGELHQSGTVYNGPADLTFTLYSTPSGGSPLAGSLSAPGVVVVDGRFTVDLDFGLPLFEAGAERWLAIAVNGVPLEPRQPLRAAPFAAYALSGGSSPFERVGTNAVYTGGNVGIGTASPSILLEVDGASSSPLVRIDNTSTSGFADGLISLTSGVTGRAVWARSTGQAARSVFADAVHSSGETVAVWGQVNSTAGTAMVATSSATTGTTHGIRASVASPSGYAGHFSGGRNYFEGNVGIGTETPTHRLQTKGSPTGALVRFENTSTGAFADGLWSSAVEGYSVYGRSAASSGGFGVVGQASANSGTPYGVYGAAPSNGHAVYAQGRMTATGTKAFQIDHPLDPENMYLNHYCVEGPEPLNVYSGNIRLDHAGRALVELPAYFESINRDVRYQLTPIGAWAPLYIAQRVENNAFVIAGGAPQMEVSWRIEAVRNDPFVATYGTPVEQDKGDQRGTYLHPELYGQPPERGLHHREQPHNGTVEPVAANNR